MFSRTLFIGDVHGCGAEFLALLEALGYPQRGDRLVVEDTRIYE